MKSLPVSLVCSSLSCWYLPSGVTWWREVPTVIPAFLSNQYTYLPGQRPKPEYQNSELEEVLAKTLTGIKKPRFRRLLWHRILDIPFLALRRHMVSLFRRCPSHFRRLWRILTSSFFVNLSFKSSLLPRLDLTGKMRISASVRWWWARGRSRRRGETTDGNSCDALTLKLKRCF